MMFPGSLMLVLSLVMTAATEYHHLEILERQSPECPFNALVYVPLSDTAKSLPLLLYLHGAGEVGDNLSKLMEEGATGTPIVELEAGRAPTDLATQFVVVAPQSRGSWDSLEIARFMDFVLKRWPNVDPSRCYVTGHSMGGIGALHAAATTNKFAACVPVAPAGTIRPHLLHGCPVWAFHGQNDVVVPSSFSEHLISALRRAGAKPEDAKLTLYEEAPTPPGWPESVGHAATIPAYATRDLYSWLLAHDLTTAADTQSESIWMQSASKVQTSES